MRTIKNIFRGLILIILLLEIMACGPAGDQPFFESAAASRYPGQVIPLNPELYSDSVNVNVDQKTVTIKAEWNTFEDTVYHCIKVGDLKLLTTDDHEVTIGQVTLTPLPCAVEWFTDDTVISEKILISALIEVKKGGTRHSFEGNFCSIDGKGKMELLKSE